MTLQQALFEGKVSYTQIMSWKKGDPRNAALLKQKRRANSWLTGLSVLVITACLFISILPPLSQNYPLSFGIFSGGLMSGCIIIYFTQFRGGFSDSDEVFLIRVAELDELLAMPTALKSYDELKEKARSVLGRMAWEIVNDEQMGGTKKSTRSRSLLNEAVDLCFEFDLVSSDEPTEFYLEALRRMSSGPVMIQDNVRVTG